MSCTRKSDVIPKVCVSGKKIAHALVNDPDLIILDEPLQGCDPLARTTIMNVIRELGRMGRTVLLSSHILSELNALPNKSSFCTKAAASHWKSPCHPGTIGQHSTYHRNRMQGCESTCKGRVEFGCCPWFAIPESNQTENLHTHLVNSTSVCLESSLITSTMSWSSTTRMMTFNPSSDISQEGFGDGKETW